VSALQFALRTEALRLGKTGPLNKAACVENNFVSVKGQEISAALDDLIGDIMSVKARNPETQTEDLIVEAINKTCGEDKLGHQTVLPDGLYVNALTAKRLFRHFQNRRG
jgi:hypothetical protein